MLQHNVHNLTYFVASNKKGKNKDEKQLSDKTLKQVLDVLANHAIKERTPDLKELDSILQNITKEQQTGNQDKKFDNIESDKEYGYSSIIKLLQQKGYLKDEKKWLTSKDSSEIKKILKPYPSELMSVSLEGD